MATTAPVSDTIRCPYCLFIMSRPEGGGPESTFRCLQCQRGFQLKHAMPGEAFDFDPPSGDATATPPAPKEKGTSPVLLMIIGLVLTALASVTTVVYTQLWPGFLFAFVLLAVVVTVMQWFARNIWSAGRWASHIAAAILLAVSLTRGITAYAFLGKANLLYLVAATFLAVVVQYLRMGGYQMSGNTLGCWSGCGAGRGETRLSDRKKRRGFWGSNCSSACSGGCGSSCGGGCGGGGCGGCGS